MIPTSCHLNSIEHLRKKRNDEHKKFHENQVLERIYINDFITLIYTDFVILFYLFQALVYNNTNDGVIQ